MKKRKTQDEGPEQCAEKIKRTRLPPRWEYCPPIGKVVAGKFLPTKTPLDSSYDHLIGSPKYHFHPEMIFRSRLVGAQPRAKIGLWVDLTNSDNFYRGDEITKKGCRFVKMRMVGHAQSPTPEQTAQFINTVDQFFQQNPNDVALVHCTHGFNRTGFLISAYLFEKEGMGIDMAVSEFAECRPNGIYKQDYLDDLIARYGDEDDEKLISSGRPLWENGPLSDEDFTNQGVYQPAGIITNGKNSVESAISAPSSTTSTISNHTTKSMGDSDKSERPLFMDGRVPGVVYVEDAEMRRSVQEKTRKFCGYKSKGFPGSQPVSLEGPGGNNNIQLFAKHPYMVSWKADGVRYLVLIDGFNRVFAFDRDNNPFHIPKMAFILLQSVGRKLNENDYLSDTLVDAEMVIDRAAGPDGRMQDIPRLLIYDLIFLQGEDVRDKNFCARFDLIDRELIRPRTEAFKAGILRREKEPIGVRRKNFWDIEFTYKIFQPNFLSCHEVDGLVFQPVNMSYTAGRFDCLLKWKPPELSTIDFQLRIVKQQKHGELTQFVACLYVLHSDQPFTTMKATKELQKYDNKIIECKFVKETKSWEFLRERTDKSHPNALSTAVSVWNTICHPIYKNDLLNYIANHSYNRKK